MDGKPDSHAAQELTVKIQTPLGSSPSVSLSFFFFFSPFSFSYFLPLLLLFFLPSQGFCVAQELSGGHFPLVAVGRGEMLPEVIGRRGTSRGTPPLCCW